MTIYEKLTEIQTELKAPKGQYNSFGKYNYRNCEDILEALKPLLKKQSLVILLSDEVVMIGTRYYVKATATITDGEGKISTTAYAREEESKKGMDGSQVTGASSSYARKYALNALFAIDDTKDSDTTNNGSKDAQTANKEYKCANCGNEILDVTTDGKLICTAADIYKRTINRYGKALCYNCAQKERENGNKNHT